MVSFLDLNARNRRALPRMSAKGRRYCRHCEERIRHSARRCRYCGKLALRPVDMIAMVTLALTGILIILKAYAII
jgi:hypothetical protein